jgi:Flp pilus assembly protein TadG
MFTIRRGRRQPGERGQALVEFALILPLFLLLIFGLIDLGRFVMTDHILSSAAREAARQAAVEASWLGSTDAGCNKTSGPKCPANLTALVTDARAAANRIVAGLGGTISDVQISCDAPGNAPTGLWTGQSCNSTTSGNLVSVRVVFTYQPITPVIGQLIGSVVRHGAATMVID